MAPTILLASLRRRGHPRGRFPHSPTNHRCGPFRSRPDNLVNLQGYQGEGRNTHNNLTASNQGVMKRPRKLSTTSSRRLKIRACQEEVGEDAKKYKKVRPPLGAYILGFCCGLEPTTPACLVLLFPLLLPLHYEVRVVIPGR